MHAPSIINALIPHYKHYKIYLQLHQSALNNIRRMVMYNRTEVLQVQVINRDFESQKNLTMTMMFQFEIAKFNFK